MDAGPVGPLNKQKRRPGLPPAPPFSEFDIGKSVS